MPAEAEPILETCIKCGTPMDVSAMEPFSDVYCPSCGEMMKVRKRFDHFEIEKFIEAGGMGKVYRARDINLNRTVALKLLRREYSADAEYVKQLGTEAKLTASVTHPFVVKVFSFGCDQGTYYIAMELVDKGSLDDLMTLQGRVPEAQVLEIGLQIAQGLRAAYRVGLIHRDVKPGNILFADAHTAKIVDFGLAVPLEQVQEGEQEVWGTPYYVAPEKLNHDPEDFRSDIYSLGGTLFHAIAGRPPFEANSASLVALKHIKSQAVSLQAFAPDVSSPTAYVINRMLARQPDDRYQSYDELIEHLEYARSELMGSSGKNRQSKTRVVVESERQENIHGYIIGLAVLFTLVMGGVLFAFKDKIVTQHAGVEELARQQVEQTISTVEQTLALARKQTVAGDAEKALKTLQPIATRQNVPASLKAWIPMHECVAHLVAGRQQAAVDIISKLLQSQAYKTDDRARHDQMHNFFAFLQAALRTEDKVDSPSNARWTGGQFESLGFFVLGLKEWNAQRFDLAVDFFQKFLTTKPESQWLWMNDFKPLAQSYRDDYAAARAFLDQASSANTAEKKAEAAKLIPIVKAKLKLPGSLPEKLRAYETSLRSQ